MCCSASATLHLIRVFVFLCLLLFFFSLFFFFSSSSSFFFLFFFFLLVLVSFLFSFFSASHNVSVSLTHAQCLAQFKQVKKKHSTSPTCLEKRLWT